MFQNHVNFFTNWKMCVVEQETPGTDCCASFWPFVTFTLSVTMTLLWPWPLCVQVKLSNPSGKPLVYQVLVAGRDARNFRIPKGDVITVPSRSTFPMAVEFTSCFLRPAEAVLVLVGRRQGSATATTLTFNLRTQIDNITPKVCLCSICCWIFLYFLILSLYNLNAVYTSYSWMHILCFSLKMYIPSCNLSTTSVLPVLFLDLFYHNSMLSDFSQ